MISVFSNQLNGDISIGCSQRNGLRYLAAVKKMFSYFFCSLLGKVLHEFVKLWKNHNLGMFLFKRNWLVQLFCFFLLLLTAYLLCYIFRTRTFRFNSLWDRMYTPITCFLFSVHIYFFYFLLPLKKPLFPAMVHCRLPDNNYRIFFFVLFCFSLTKTIYQTTRSLCAGEKKDSFST